MRIIPLKPAAVIKILKRLGFESIRQRGSHIFFRHPDGRTTVVPYHQGEDISRGLLRKILQDIDTEWETFISYR